MIVFTPLLKNTFLLYSDGTHNSLTLLFILSTHSSLTTSLSQAQ
jgi:hypothetical protein